MAIQNIPTLVENESSEPMYPRGSGAKRLLIIGDTGAKPTTVEIKAFNDYASAVTEYGPEATGNVLLKAIKDVFVEGSIFNVSLDKLGIDSIYACNCRTENSGDMVTKDFTDAMTLGESLPEQEIIELYVGCSDLDVMGDVKTHAATMRGMGLKRTGIFTIDGDSDVITDKIDILKMTDSGVTGYIASPFVYVHVDPNMQAAFAAKAACTEYFMDPGYKPYRSKTMSDILTMGRQDADDYTGAGFVVDGPSINPDFVGRPEPYMAVSTAYRIGDGGTRPVDAYMHHRFNMDHQSVTTNNIALAMIKKNNTISARAMVEASCTGYLQSEVSAGNLQAKTTTDDGKPADPGFFVEIKVDAIDPFKLIKNMKARPQGSVHMIEDNEIIQAPVAGGA